MGRAGLRGLQRVLRTSLPRGSSLLAALRFTSHVPFASTGEPATAEMTFVGTEPAILLLFAKFIPTTETTGGKALTILDLLPN